MFRQEKSIPLLVALNRNTHESERDGFQEIRFIYKKC